MSTKWKRFLQILGIIKFILIVLVVALLAACGGKQTLVTVPEGVQAGELVGIEPCMYEGEDAAYVDAQGLNHLAVLHTGTDDHTQPRALDQDIDADQHHDTDENDENLVVGPDTAVKKQHS